MKYFLSGFPQPDVLLRTFSGKNSLPEFREANVHIHTPYSFSAFPDISTIFEMARKENIPLLGINDFFVADGYSDFYSNSLKNSIFPIFNIEFIGLLKDEQRKGIRINDPNNPGRIYFSGKGLDYPFNPGFLNRLRLKSVIRESQMQMKTMISKLNRIIEPIRPGIRLSYEEIKRRYAHDLVRERHLARALRIAAMENFDTSEEQLHFLENLFGGIKPKAGLDDTAALENEIRAKLLKSGGAAFVEESEESFLELKKIISMVLKAGGIPCYPVLLDDSQGKFTEYEKNYENLYSSLLKYDIGCIELIPGRNDPDMLRSFVEFFNDRNFIITFGTEHNTPELIPLKVTARGNIRLDDTLKKIAWEGACVIAAHQYLRAQGRQGYMLPEGKPSFSQKKELAYLGKLVIEFFLSKYGKNETGNC